MTENVIKGKKLEEQHVKIVPPDEYKTTVAGMWKLVKYNAKAVLYHNELYGYEVHKYRVRSAEQIQTRSYPERYWLPSNSEFGKYAWHTPYKERAEALFKAISEGG